MKQFADRLRGVYIESLDWTEIVERYDTPETVFYCDPPYIAGHEMYQEDTIDHQQLYERLCNADGKAVVSYSNIPPFYDEQWQAVTIESGFKIDNVDSTGPRDATETLLMNFDADGQPVMSGVGQQTLTEY